MKKQFTTYEIALKLKKLGFNEPCFKYFCDGEVRNFYKIKSQGCEIVDFEETTNSEIDLEYEDCSFPEDDAELGIKYSEPCAAPLWGQAIDWLETNGYYPNYSSRIFLWNITPPIFEGWCVYIGTNNPEVNLECNNYFLTHFYSTKYEAREKAILKAIELINLNRIK